MIFLIVNMVIGIATDVMFVIFISSDGCEYVFMKNGLNLERIRRHNNTIHQAITNGMLCAIPILNAILLTIYIVGYAIFNRKKGS